MKAAMFNIETCVRNTFSVGTSGSHLEGLGVGFRLLTQKGSRLFTSVIYLCSLSSGPLLLVPSSVSFLKYCFLYFVMPKL